MKDIFAARHIGIGKTEQEEMLAHCGVQNIEELIRQTIPQKIRLAGPMQLPEVMSERAYLEHISDLAAQN